MILILLISVLPVVDATEVDVSANIYKDFTTFNYVIEFDNTVVQNNFSIKVPYNSTIDYAVDEKESIEYTKAGDRYIFTPNKLLKNTVLIKLKSKTLSEEVLQTEVFKTHLGFDFKIDKLDFRVIPQYEFGEVIDAFPREYNYTSNKVIWKVEEVSENQVYIVNFKEKIITEVPEIKPPVKNYYTVIISTIIAVLVIVLLGLLYLKYYKKSFKKSVLEVIKEQEKEETKESSQEEIKEDEKIKKTEPIIIIQKEEKLQSEQRKTQESEKTVENQESEQIIEEVKTRSVETKNMMFNQVIEKHLTEKEQSIVKIVKENQGILQNEILNFLPQLTKSNLSKIISKLHSLKYISRIKVGKVNKIYLSEKLDFEDERLEE